MNRIRVTIAFILAALSSVASAQWVNINDSAATTTVNLTPWTYVNNTSSTVTFNNVSGTSTEFSIVSGDSPSPGPSWDSPFGTIYSAYVSQSWNYSTLSVDPAYTGQITVSWFRTQGTDEWYDEDTQTYASRTCDIWVGNGVTYNEFLTVGGQGVGGH